MKIVGVINDINVKEQLKKKYPEIELEIYKNMKLLLQDEKIETAEVLVAHGGRITEELIKKAKNLKWLMVLYAGVEQLPFEILKERNILVTNASGIHKIPMGEFVIGAMLSYVKQTSTFKKQQDSKKWPRTQVLGELFKKKILVVGAGSIGGHIAKLAKAFGMKTLGINRSGQLQEDFDEMFTLADLNHALPQADFVVSVLPSTNETQNVFTNAQFSSMKKSAVFINVGRGDAVDEEDLLEALNKGEIAHATLDVFREEPLPSEHPFWESDKVTISPHVCGVTDRYLERALEVFKDNLDLYVKGNQNLNNIVNLERGY